MSRLLGTQVSPITSPEPPDPDNNVDNDDNGARAIGQPAFSKAITLDYNTEPTPGVGNDTNTTLVRLLLSRPPPVITNLGGDNYAPRTVRRCTSTPAPPRPSPTIRQFQQRQPDRHRQRRACRRPAFDLTNAILLNGSTVQYDADGARHAPVDIGTAGGSTANLVVTFSTTDATPAAVSA
jgi:hypothetical protein